MDFEKDPTNGNQPITGNPYGMQNIQIGPMTLNYAKKHPLKVELFGHYTYTGKIGELELSIPNHGSLTKHRDSTFYFKNNDGVRAQCTNT